MSQKSFFSVLLLNNRKEDIIAWMLYGRRYRLSLPSEGQTHRYLCYVSGGHGDKNAITLVYMEGKVESIDELRKLIQ